MKKIFSIILVPFFLLSCHALEKKEQLLTKAGFHLVIPTTPAQIAQLQSIKSHKVIPLLSKQGTVYLFADKAKKALIIGTPSEYQQYRALKLKQQKIDEQLLDAQVSMDNADYSA